MGHPVLTGSLPSGPHGGPLLAAEYFGGGDPANLWNSDLSGAAAELEQMKQDGFNAVGLVVPWGEFQEHLTPPRYNEAAFVRLRGLVALAARLGMKVILRLSYQLDVDPYDQLPYQRFASVFASGPVHAAWLEYISRIHQAVERFPNVEVAYLTWEDFWVPVQIAQAASTLAEREQLAVTLGFRSWLRTRYSLGKVARLYRTPFHSWSEVPTPPNATPPFKLVYQYVDWSLIHKLFIPAAKRFPGLNLEARVDVDALYNEGRIVGSYSHQSTYRLPGAKYVGLYYSPYMMDPSSAKIETAQEALDGLKSTLTSMRARAGGKSLYIFEFEFVSNSPEVASAPALPANQVGPFLEQSAPILRAYTRGYALWVYRDYALSPLYNPSFALASRGWSLAGGARAEPDASGGGSATIPTGGSVTQPLVVSDLVTPPGAQNLVVSLSAGASNSAATMRISVGNLPPRVVTVSGPSRSYQVTLPLAAVLSGPPTQPLTLAVTNGTAVVNQVEASAFTQLGDVYGVDGTPGIAAPAIRALNQEMTAPRAPLTPLSR
ncbi:MAG TPA: hypothetical protein VKV36_11930 [Acidimicrobiales bacterium]|nr:hypothetical protein [Acidimicrobiales bacterium]